MLHAWILVASLVCARDVKINAHRGAAIDLDLENADLHDVLRLLADVGKLNLVVSGEVNGKVTLHLRHVAWDAALCAVVATHKLTVILDDSILIVTRHPRVP